MKLGFGGVYKGMSVKLRGLNPGAEKDVTETSESEDMLGLREGGGLSSGRLGVLDVLEDRDREGLRKLGSGPGPPIDM